MNPSHLFSIWRVVTRAAPAALAVHLASPLFGQCEPSWSAPFGGPAGASPQAMVTFDFDGPGPDPARLVIAGNVTTADGQTGNRVSWYDGKVWHAYAGTFTGGTVNAITFHDFDGDGPEPAHPVIGGTFTAVGGVNANFIARWTGTGWAPIGESFNTDLNLAVLALTSFDGDGSGPLPAYLYAGGRFERAGATVVNHVARWDGSAWRPLGTGVTHGSSLHGVRAFYQYDTDGAGPLPPRLFVGGGFFVNGTGLANVAVWTGVSWFSATNPGGSVTAMTAYDIDGPGPNGPSLVCAFESFGSAVARVAGPGGSWSTLSVTGGVITGLAAFDPDGPGEVRSQLIACGNFRFGPGGTTLETVAGWNGTAWTTLGPRASIVSLALDDITTWDPDGEGPETERVAIGGVFHPPAADVEGLGGLGIWDGSEWSTIGDGLVGNGNVPGINQVVRFDLDGTTGSLGEEIIAVGNFRSAAGITLGGVARWNGESWAPVGAGFPGAVTAALVWDRDGAGPLDAELFVAVSTPLPDGSVSNTIQRWDSGAWQLLTVSPRGGGPVYDLLAMDPDGDGPIGEQLHVCGSFNGGALNRVARWDGSAWQPLATGLNGTVLVMKKWDADGEGPLPASLVVGGEFTSAGASTSTPYIARWDGTAWSRMASGPGTSIEYHVRDIEVYDPDGAAPPVLVAAGGIATGVVMWNGTTWQTVGAGLRGAFFGDVDCLASFDPDGPGPTPLLLIAGGRFTHSGATPMRALASWNGAAWTGLVTGIGDGERITDFLPFDLDGPGPRPEQLMVAGGFTTISNVLAAGLAVWQHPVPAHVLTHPAATTSCAGELRLSVRASGWPIPSFQWRHDGADLVDGPTPAGSVISGSAASVLVVAAPAAADAGTYDCVVTNECGSAISLPADVGVCGADFNCDATVSSQDFFDFLGAFFSEAPHADVNRDGGVNSQDFFDFQAVFFKGCS